MNNKLLKAAKLLFIAVSSLEERIGCGCGGDGWVCRTCKEAQDSAEEARIGWIKAREEEEGAASSK